MTEAPLHNPTGIGQDGGNVVRGGAQRKQTPDGRTGFNRLTLALLAFGFAPLLVEFFVHLWGRPYYQFFPSALLGAGFLAWFRVKELPRPLAPGGGRMAGALMGGSFCLLFLAMVANSPWLATLAAELGGAGLAWWMGGRPLLRAVLPALVLLLTIIPPPLSEDEHLMLYLRGLAVRWSSRVLDALGVFHFLSGNVIELPRTNLLVEEACSGINSVLFTSAACLMYLLWRRRPVWWILVCLPCVVAGVLLGNVIRITLGAWLSFHQIADILSGWKHELTGLILVALYLVLIPSLDELLEFLTCPIREKPAVPASPAVVPPAVETARVYSSGAVRRGLAAGCAFALVGVAELAVAEHQHNRDQRVLSMENRSALPAGAVFTMPAQIGDWKRLDSPVPDANVETDGIFSKIWHYQRGNTVANVALDYPFRGYHDVTLCYNGNGWHVTRKERQYGEGASASQPLMEVEMNKEPISQGLLWFSTVDEHGHWMESPQESFLNRWQLPGSGEPYTTTSYRVQVLVTSYGPLPDAERKPARELFEAARKILVPQLFSQMPPKS